MDSVINWFQIPVTDFDRACDFYSKILGVEIHKDRSFGAPMGFFPMEPNTVSGALVQHEGFNPSDKGTLIYLDGGEDLNNVLNRVEGAGGKIVEAKRQITPDIGFLAKFKDTEGNVVALHSRK